MTRMGTRSPLPRQALGPDLDRVAGTSLDTGAELGALTVPTTAALVPDLTFRGDIKLNPRLRLHRSYGALASLAPDIAPFGFTMAQPSRQDIRRDGFVCLTQGYELHLANMPDDDRLDLVEMRRQITNLRSQHSDNLIVTSRLNRFLVRIAFLLEPKDAAHARHIRSEFVRTLRSIEEMVSQRRSTKRPGFVKRPK